MTGALARLRARRRTVGLALRAYVGALVLLPCLHNLDHRLDHEHGPDGYSVRPLEHAHPHPHRATAAAARAPASDEPAASAPSPGPHGAAAAAHFGAAAPPLAIAPTIVPAAPVACGPPPPAPGSPPERPPYGLGHPRAPPIPGTGAGTGGRGRFR